MSVYDESIEPKGQAQWMWVTPVRAMLWLERLSSNQRQYVEGNAEKWLVEMLTGRWKASMQDAICITEDGELDNGRHRLEALIKSELSGLWMFVATQTDPDAYDVYDSGRVRRLRDNIKGEYLTTLAAALARDFLIDNNICLAGTKSHVSSVAGREHLKDNPGLRESVSYIMGLNKTLSCSTPTTLATTHMHLVRKTGNREAVDAYFTYLTAWDGSVEGATSRRIRSRVKDLPNTIKFVHDQMNLLIHGWNLWIAGKLTISRIEISGIDKHCHPNHPLVTVRKCPKVL